ncbi:MAG: 50S ribosomal protein L18 [Ignavibacteria bacterium]|nr:50S ribosomal protein L18 [Ignavibacteria bacterium]
MIIKSRSIARRKIQVRVRKKISGTSERPRLCVYRSLLHIYAQIIDDTMGNTLCSTSTLSPSLSEQLKEVKGKMNISKIVGKEIARVALEKNITRVVFDRSGYLFHGNIKSLADGAREGGLKF